MTDQELLEIEARAMMATSGPLETELPESWGLSRVIRPEYGTTIAEVNGREDAILFAHAQGDIARLLAEVRRLQSELGRAQASWQANYLAADSWQQSCKTTEKLLEGAERERDEARAALAHISGLIKMQVDNADMDHRARVELAIAMTQAQLASKDGEP